MGILGQIGKRLQTDLADTARAVVDPKFSQQLTDARFKEKQLERSEEAWLTRHSLERREKIKDQARSEKFKIQMNVVGQLVKEGEVSGDFSKLVDFADKTPELLPNVSGFARLMGSSASKKSWEVLKQEGQWNKDYAGLNLKQQRLLLDQNRFKEDQQNHLMDYYQKNKEFYIEQVKDLQKKAEETKSVYSIQQFFRNDPNMTEEQRQRYSGIVQEPGMDLSTAQKALDGYLREVDTGLKQVGINKRAINKSNKSEHAIFKDFREDYQSLTKDVRKAQEGISEMESLLDQPRSAATSKAITAKVSNIFGSKVRALAELQQWNNLGDITQRLGGAISGFFTGNRTESQYQDLKNLIGEYKKQLVIEDNAFKADTWDRAKNFLNTISPSELFPGQTRFVTKEYQGKQYLVDTWRKTTKEIGAVNP